MIDIDEELYTSIESVNTDDHEYTEEEIMNLDTSDLIDIDENNEELTEEEIDKIISGGYDLEDIDKIGLNDFEDINENKILNYVSKSDTNDIDTLKNLKFMLECEKNSSIEMSDNGRTIK